MSNKEGSNNFKSQGQVFMSYGQLICERLFWRSLGFNFNKESEAYNSSDFKIPPKIIFPTEFPFIKYLLKRKA